MDEAKLAIARIEESVKHVAKDVEVLQNRLFGNGQPGMIEDLREDVKEVRKEMQSRHDENCATIAEIRTQLSKYVGMAIGAIVFWEFLSGKGTISLEKLLSVLGH